MKLKMKYDCVSIVTHTTMHAHDKQTHTSPMPMQTMQIQKKKHTHTHSLFTIPPAWQSTTLKNN